MNFLIKAYCGGLAPIEQKIFLPLPYFGLATALVTVVTLQPDFRTVEG